MDISTTGRGFGLIKFNDSYSEECSIQQSSANGDYIWIGIDNPNPKIMASKAEQNGIKTDETAGWIKYNIPDDVLINTRMHLNREQIKELLPHLQKFVETGEII